MGKPEDEVKAYDQLCQSYRAIDDFRRAEQLEEMSMAEKKFLLSDGILNAPLLLNHEFSGRCAP